MIKIRIIKQLATSAIIVAMLVGCVAQNNFQSGSNNIGMTKTQQGALIGGILGAVLGGITKGKHKSKRVFLGGAIGAAIGGGIGYSLDQQAKEIAQTLETDVNNNPNAKMNSDNDLIVSNTDQYVKIMLRDNMVFAANSAVPTVNASRKISKISNVLKRYPNTIVQVIGFTDNRGSYAYNQTLSEQRASNIGNTLYNSDISNQVFTKGCSYNKPIASNTTKENMALNRRVEIYLYPNQNSIIDACVQ